MTLNLDPKKLLDTAYIFEKTPPATGFYLYLAILFGLFVGFAILGWLWLTRKKDQLPFWKEYRIKIFNLFFYNGVIGLVLIFSRWQGIPYAGSRFFLLCEVILFFFWGLSIIYFRFIILAKKIREYEKQQQFEKYLPQRQVRRN